MRILLTLFITLFLKNTFGQIEQKQYSTNFLPKGYALFKEIVGDLNNDDKEDCILLIKGTDTNQIITDKDRGVLDRNRSGLIILFNKNGLFELAAQNENCFSSENEDGGVYFPPELLIDIKKSTLYIHFAHGRYGYCRYTFRYQNSTFELIGYDEGYRSNHISDCITFDEESINFLTKKKVIKEVSAVDKNCNTVYKNNWQKITIPNLIKLSEIQDFDELNMSYQVCNSKKEITFVR